MKTIATGKLTLTYLQKLHWQNYFATTMAVLAVAFSVFWMSYRLGGSGGTTLFSDLMFGLAALSAAVCAWLTVYRARRGPIRLERRLQLAWFFIGAGMFMNAAGGFCYTFIDYSGQKTSTPSLADVCFFLVYPLLFVGLLCMISGPRSERLRILMIIDALISTLCVLGVSWFFAIGPIYMTLHDQGVPLARFIMTAIYPFMDMLLVFVMVFFIQYPVERVLRPSLYLAGIASLFSIWADIGYALLMAQNTYVSGTVYIDPFWYTFSFLIGLTALYQYTTIACHAYGEHMHLLNRGSEQIVYISSANNEGERRPEHALFIQSFLVYIPFVVLLTLMIYANARQDGRELFLDLLTAITGVLVVVRYLLTSYENGLLLQTRDRRRREAERLRLLTAQLSEILELKPLVERIVGLASSVLVFDSAVLLIEEKAPFPGMPGSLLVYAAASAVQKVANWRFHGLRLPYCTPLQGKEVEVVWEERPDLDLPAQIAAWQQEQRIQATFFVPLYRHGKAIGALGFSSRSMRQFSEYDKGIARSFVTQAGIALEHAYLYQQAREQETFAQALANIATRLNTAIAEPSEIQQVICSEGLNALRADYALLYTPAYKGDLLPTALAVSEQEPPSELRDWPIVYEHEYEAQALGSPQPVLMQLAHLYTPDPSMSPCAAAASSPRRPRMRRETSLREMLAKRFIPSAILIPLFAENAAVGLLILARSLRPGVDDKRAYTQSDLPQALSFAEQAAVAYTNATLYRQLRTAHQQLQELDQLKDQFMITASHELRTPLTAVQGYLELMAQYGDSLPPEQRHEFLHKTRIACDELVLLLNNVMDASRLEVDAGIRPAHIESVSVEEIVQSVLDMLAPQISQEERPVSVDIAPHIVVQADPVRLRQILRNLSMNALKYSPAGSPLFFSARVVMDSVPCAIISVADRGQGIAPADQPRLFERFVRLECDVNSPVRGSGLGLYISRRLVEAMKGKIWLESSGVPGEGSVFHVQLPMAPMPGQ